MTPYMNNVPTAQLGTSFYLHPTGNGELETVVVLCLLTLRLDVRPLYAPFQDGDDAKEFVPRSPGSGDGDGGQPRVRVTLLHVARSAET